jgi:hypothetical protein
MSDSPSPGSAPSPSPTPVPASGTFSDAAPPRKGPLSFLSGALTSAVLGWLCLGFSQRLLTWYAAHPPHYASPVAQSIATAVKTLILGMSFLATFSFLFIGLGLFLTFLRSLLPAGASSPP